MVPAEVQVTNSSLMGKHSRSCHYQDPRLGVTALSAPCYALQVFECLTRMSLKLMGVPGGAWHVRKLEACPKR